jgi:DHA1 family inner membrane transport protein
MPALKRSFRNDIVPSPGKICCMVAAGLFQGVLMSDMRGAVAGSNAAKAGFDKRIFLLAAAIFATGTDAYVIAGILPAVGADINASSGMVGQLITAYMIVFALGSPFLAVMAAGWRRNRLIISCLVIFAIADGVCAVAPGFAILLAARIVAALCSATYTPAAFAIAVALSPANRRGTSLAILSFALVGAQLCGVPFGTWVAYHLGWRLTFGLNMGLVLLAAVVVWSARIPEMTAGVQPNLRERLMPLTNPRLMMAVFPSILWAAANSAVTSYISVIFGPRFGLESVPLLFVCIGLGGLVGSQVGGRLTDRFGPVVTISVCLCMNAVNFALLNVTGSTFVGACVALFAYACCGWALFPSLQSLLLAIEPKHSSVVLSLSNSAGYLGVGTGAALGAFVLGQSTAAALPYAASGVMLIAMLAWLIGVQAVVRPNGVKAT